MDAMPESLHFLTQAAQPLFLTRSCRQDLALRCRDGRIFRTIAAKYLFDRNGKKNILHFEYLPAHVNRAS